jgi:ADP-heptose:LPS heptosyltransferase
MKIIQTRRGLSVSNEYGLNMELPPGEDFVVADAMPTMILRQSGSEVLQKIEDFKPENMWKGEDLAGKSLIAFRTGGIGDLIAIVTCLRALKVKYPTSTLVLGCSPNFGRILQFPEIYDQIQLPMKLAELKKRDYCLFFEKAIETNPEAETKSIYDIFREIFHLTEDEFKMVKPAISEDTLLQPDVDSVIRKFEALNGPFCNYKHVLVQISASVPKRSVPLATYIEMIARSKDNVKFWFVGNQAQLKEIHQVIETFASTPYAKKVIDLSKYLPKMEQVTLFVKKVDVVMGPDSSLLHIAGCLGKPMIGLFGPFPSQLRLLYYDNAVGIDANSQCEYARGEYKSCFEHSNGSCQLAQKILEYYSPCMRLINSKHIFQGLNALGFDFEKKIGG